MQLQIARLVVFAVAVLVMNDFAWEKVAPKQLFHDESMFEDVSALGPVRMVRGMDKNIPMACVEPAFVVARSASEHGFFLGCPYVLWDRPVLPVPCIVSADFVFNFLRALRSDFVLVGTSQRATWLMGS